MIESILVAIKIMALLVAVALVVAIPFYIADKVDKALLNNTESHQGISIFVFMLIVTLEMGIVIYLGRN